MMMDNFILTIEYDTVESVSSKRADIYILNYKKLYGS